MLRTTLPFDALYPPMKNYFIPFLVILAFAIPTFAPDQLTSTSRTQLKSAIESGKAILLDAAGTASYSQAHIPGALDFDAVRAELASKLPADKGALIVAYCANERCPYYRKAAAAAKAL